MTFAYYDCLMVSGEWINHPKISKTTKGMIMKFLPEVGTHMEAQSQKNFLT